MSILYKDLIAAEERNREVTADVSAALARGRNCLVLTNWTTHLETLADLLRGLGHEPVVLRGGMGARQGAPASPASSPSPAGRPCSRSPLGSCAGEGFDCAPLDTLCLVARSRTRVVSISTSAISCAPIPGKPLPRRTTTTTS